MLDVKKWSTQWGGRELTVEVGRFAIQATAACTVRYGDTVMMATVVKSKQERDLDYFPLLVSLEEKMYAAGKIKGSRFIKREGRPSDESILNGRIVDRSIRPLFDDTVRNEIQLVLTALVVDGENDATICSLIASSVVLAISPIRWEGPIAGARIGMNDKDEFILNVTHKELAENNKLDLIVVGSPEKIIMVEGGANEVAEDVMYKAMEWGAQNLKPALDLIKKIQAEIGQEKEAAPIIDPTSETAKVIELVKNYVTAQADTVIFNSKKITKRERNAMVDQIKEGAKEMLVASGIAEEFFGSGLGKTKDFVSDVISKRILDKEERLDGRALTEVREIGSEIDLLPRVHGSGFFMRGDTHVLSIVTLGAPGDVQTLDSMEEEGTKRYMHHYNDAPYTYGEAGFMRGPSRRAIGHGALAERALMPVLPAEADFPYAIRVVSEVMSSNGSSSMASTCGSTLSLMAAGVPLKKPVAGIAMGLSSDDQGRYKVLTDLQDVEDGKGGMDFKITGTADGITAMQMDTKTLGLNWDIIKQTLTRSKEARLQILEKMAEVIAEPRKELAEYAPRIETIMIDPEKIRDVIGPGGKVINKIIEETGVQIDIEQDGRVLITSSDGEGLRKAKEIITNLTKEVQAGEEYDGKVVRLEDFGAFVNILPNKDGLVHVSEIAWERTNSPSEALKLNQEVKVKVKEIDSMGRVNLSIKALLPKPEGFVEQPPRERTGGGDRGSRPQSGGGYRGGQNRNSQNRSSQSSSTQRTETKSAPRSETTTNPAQTSNTSTPQQQHVRTPETTEKPQAKPTDEQKKKRSLFGFGKKE